MAYSLTAYIVGDAAGWTLAPASPRRPWMDEIPAGFAYRCLPLVMGNQAGWTIACPCDFTATWNGAASHVGSISVELAAEDERRRASISSHFGHGILTFSLPYLFRTSPGFGLLVRGPTNTAKPGAAPLDAFVETDWAVATFTMNWRLLEPGRPVRFERGETICTILPVPMGAVEEFDTTMAPIDDNPDLRDQFRAWGQSRRAFNADPARTGDDWQKHYISGTSPGGARADDHRTNLRLAPFRAPPADKT